MKTTKLLILIIAISLNTVFAQESSVKDSGFPAFEYRYLGQKPPGLNPKMFAPGIVSTEEYRETVVTFLPDMTEFGFTRSGGEYKRPTLIVMQYKNHKWSRKSILSTDEKKYGEMNLLPIRSTQSSLRMELLYTREVSIGNEPNLDGQSSKVWEHLLQTSISWGYRFQTKKLFSLITLTHQIQLERSVIHAL